MKYLFSDAWAPPENTDPTPDFIRVAGDYVCEACKRPTWRHPMDEAVRSALWPHHPFLFVLCGGRRAKT